MKIPKTHASFEQERYERIVHLAFLIVLILPFLDEESAVKAAIRFENAKARVFAFFLLLQIKLLRFQMKMLIRREAWRQRRYLERNKKASNHDST